MEQGGVLGNAKILIWGKRGGIRAFKLPLSGVEASAIKITSWKMRLRRFLIP